VEEVKLTVEAENVPLNSYKPNFPTDEYFRELRDFYDNTNIKTHPFGNAITPELYKSGTCLFAWDFSPDRCVGMEINISFLKMRESNLPTFYRNFLFFTPYQPGYRVDPSDFFPCQLSEGCHISDAAATTSTSGNWEQWIST
jgi:hypothetical protein